MKNLVLHAVVADHIIHNNFNAVHKKLFFYLVVPGHMCFQPFVSSDLREMGEERMIMMCVVRDLLAAWGGGGEAVGKYWVAR